MPWAALCVALAGCSSPKPSDTPAVTLLPDAVVAPSDAQCAGARVAQRAERYDATTIPGVVMDEITGVSWQRDLDASAGRSWPDADQYCQGPRPRRPRRLAASYAAGAGVDRRLCGVQSGGRRRWLSRHAIFRLLVGLAARRSTRDRVARVLEGGVHELQPVCVPVAGSMRANRCRAVEWFHGGRIWSPAPTER